MNPIDVTKFLGLRNTVSQAQQPLGSLANASNVLIDDSGAIIRRQGCLKIADGAITSSYGTRDNSAMYLIDGGKLFKFTGDYFVLLFEGMGSGVCLWAEESSNLIFAHTEYKFIAIVNGDSVIELDVPVIEDSSIEVGTGKLPAMQVRFAAQYVSIETGLRGALCDPQTIALTDNSSVLFKMKPKDGYYLDIFGEFPDSGAWSYIASTDNFYVLTDYPNVSEPADDIYFDVANVPKDAVAITYHTGKICVVTLTNDSISLVQFSIPTMYHLFDTINEAFEIPDTITSVASSNGVLVLTGIRSIWTYADGALQRLTTYGTPVGKPMTQLPTGELLIWTNRGVCQFPEFKNLTENVFSVPAGFGCATNLFERNGSKYLAIATDDLGQAFNANFDI